MEYTPKEVAERLGVSRQLITQYLNTGKIIGFKVSPRKWVIPEDSLKAYLEKLNNITMGGNE